MKRLFRHDCSYKKIVCTLVLLIFGILFFPIMAFANPYDDCILQYMGSAKDQTAVYDIERACISKSSISLTQDQVKNINNPAAYPGSYNMGDGSLENGLVIEFKNFTSFDITSIDVIITSKEPLHKFLIPLSI